MCSLYAFDRLETRVVITVISVSVVVIAGVGRSRIIGGFVAEAISVVAVVIGIVAGQIVVVVRDRIPVILRVPSTVIIT